MAQSAPAASSPQEEKPLELSPFTVRTDKDVGYRSLFSNSGSLVSEELRNLPLSISVLNQDLIEDIAATDIFEISKYAAGGEYIRNPTNDTQFNFRGITNNWQTRNFFIWYLPTDSFSIDRMEVLRGPNALLYGDAAPGGLANIITKRAQFKDFSRVRVQVGSWNRLRGEVDYNKQLGKNLAVRLNLVDSHTNDFRDYRKQDFRGAHLAATYRPFKNTEVRVEAEIGELERNVGTFMFVDQFSSFDPAVSATAGTAVRTGDANNYYISYDGNTALRYGAAGFRRSNGTSLVIDQTSPFYGIAPREWQFTGPSAFLNRDYSQLSATIQQRLFEKLTLEATVNRQDNHNKQLRSDFNSLEVRRDAQPTLPDGSVNPNYGELYVDNRFSKDRFTNHVTDIRLAASYLLELPFGVEQRLVGYWSDRTDSFQRRRWGERFASNPAVQVYRRTYFDQYGTKDLSWELLNNGQSILFGDSFARNINSLTNRSVAALGSYWDKRVHTMVGYVRHYWNVSRRNAVIVPVGNTTEQVGFQPDWIAADEIRDDSLNYGGVFHVLRDFHGATVSLVGNYSEAFQPTGNVFDVFNETIPPIKGQGKEFGVRLELMAGKVVIAATKFNIDVVNNRVNVAQNVRDEVNSLFGAGLAGGSSAGDTNTLNSKGFEVELTLNPTKQWTLTANYSHADLSQTDVLPRLLPYWEQARAANLPVTQYVNLNNLVSPAVTNATVVAPERKHVVNAFTRYTFSSGPLAGLTIGGGANYRSSAYLGIVGTSYYYAPSSTVFSGLLGYKLKVFDRAVDLALNVNNLTDKLTYTGFALGAATWDAPREYRLTATVRF